MRTVLFKTLHGSRLYNLAHDDSDVDYYTVVTKLPADARWGRQARAQYAKQTIIDGVDTLVIDFGTWMNQCTAGVSQALEAMFSTRAIEDNIAPFRASYRAGSQCWSTYYKTIKSFALSGIKKRRHALRFGLNLNEMGRCGRLNPSLTDEDARYITWMSHKSHSDVLGLALCEGWNTPTSS